MVAPVQTDKIRVLRLFGKLPLWQTPGTEGCEDWCESVDYDYSVTSPLSESLETFDAVFFHGCQWASSTWGRFKPRELIKIAHDKGVITSAVCLESHAWGTNLLLGRNKLPVTARMTPFPKESELYLPYRPAKLQFPSLNDTLSPNKRLLVYVASNPNSKGWSRTQFAKGILQAPGMKGKMDCPGHVLHNAELAHFPKKPDAAWKKHLTEFYSEYKFVLAFENALEVDYVSEKFWLTIQAGSVPVYMGAPNIADHAPPGSYVDARRFKSASSLAAYLQSVANNLTAYQEFFSWRPKEDTVLVSNRSHASRNTSSCAVCDFVLKNRT